ncbi:MAG: thioredoxin domain-containing protein [Sulfurospirillaceae bacterium]|nr:thioredoxin domain-containing protein [Sulfurospirillaceae bacterium]
MKKQTLIVTSIVILIALYIAGSFAYKYFYLKNLNENASVFVRAHSPIIGNEKATTTIVEFFDPACGTCKAFSPFVKNIIQKHPDKLKLVLRYAPFHTDSYYVVQMLEASKLQNRYFETLDVIFKHQEKWAINHSSNIAKLWSFLPEAGLDVEKLKNDMKRPEIDAIIKQDIADSKLLGVNQTPEFFVNGKPLKRFGYKELEELINSEL